MIWFSSAYVFRHWCLEFRTGLLVNLASDFHPKGQADYPLDLSFDGGGGGLQQWMMMITSFCI